MKKVLVVGSAEQSGGGVTSVIKLIKKMPVWEKYSCYWLGTQIQGTVFVKLWYALSAYIKALFIIWKYDIVHFHTVPDQSMTVQLPVLLLALAGKKKVIFHIHCGNQLGMDMCTKNKIAHWCMGKADVIVLLAHSFKPLLFDYWLKKINPDSPLEGGSENVSPIVSVVYNPVEKVKSIPYAQHDKTILFAGMFNKNKSADVLVKAFAQLMISGDVREGDWMLVLLGRGPEEDNLRKLVHELGIEKKVEMPGYIFGERKKEYFQKAGIYAMCSQYEGMPMVVMESWGYGVPVVSTPVGGMPDVIEDGRNCLTFDFGDVDGLAKQLGNLIGDYELRVKMSEYSKVYVNKNFSMEKINEDLISLYESIC